MRAMISRTFEFDCSEDPTTVICDSQKPIADCLTGGFAGEVMDQAIGDAFGKPNTIATLAIVKLSGEAQYSMRATGDAWFTLTPTFEPSAHLAADGGIRAMRFKGNARLQVHMAFVH